MVVNILFAKLSSIVTRQPTKSVCMITNGTQLHPNSKQPIIVATKAKICRPSEERLLNGHTTSRNHSTITVPNNVKPQPAMPRPSCQCNHSYCYALFVAVVIVLLTCLVVAFSFSNVSVSGWNTTSMPLSTTTTRAKDADLPEKGASDKEHHYSMTIFFILLVVGKLVSFYER